MRQHGDRVDVEPVAVVDTEGQREPVGQIDQALVVDLGPRDVIDEPVVHPGHVGARVVHLPGLRLGRGSPGSEVAVSQRAQRLTELFALRIVSVEDVIPGLARHLVLVCQPPGSALDELAHLVRALQAEVGSRPAVAVLVVSDDDPYAVELDRVERVFVGEIVTDVDRQ